MGGGHEGKRVAVPAARVIFGGAGRPVLHRGSLQRTISACSRSTTRHGDNVPRYMPFPHSFTALHIISAA